MSPQQWTDRVVVWGIGAAVPVICVLGLWLLVTARGGQGKPVATTLPAEPGRTALATAPLDVSTPPAVELHRPQVSTVDAVAGSRPTDPSKSPAQSPCSGRELESTAREAAVGGANAAPAAGRRRDPRRALGPADAGRCLHP